jgi:hypothetical protein
VHSTLQLFQYKCSNHPAAYGDPLLPPSPACALSVCCLVKSTLISRCNSRHNQRWAKLCSTLRSYYHSPPLHKQLSDSTLMRTFVQPLSKTTWAFFSRGCGPLHEQHPLHLHLHPGSLLRLRLHPFVRACRCFRFPLAGVMPPASR